MDGLLGLWIIFAMPIGVLLFVAVVRGHSLWTALWGLLSWPGMVIGLLVLLFATPRTKLQAAEESWQTAGSPSRPRATDQHRYCRHCGGAYPIVQLSCDECGTAWRPSGRPGVEVLADALNYLNARRGDPADMPAIAARHLLESELAEQRRLAGPPTAPAEPASAVAPDAAPSWQTMQPVQRSAFEAAPQAQVAPIVTDAATVAAPEPAVAPIIAEAAPGIASDATRHADAWIAPAPGPEPVPGSAGALAAPVAASSIEPPRDTSLVLRRWAARRQADLLLYLGAFLLSIAALTFLNYQGDALSGTGRTAILAGYTVAFLVMGFGVRRWDRVREAGPVFVALGAVLTPLTLLMLYVQVLRDEELSRAGSLLLGSVLTGSLYAWLSRQGFGKVYLVPAAIAGLVSWGALAATLELPNEWFGAWYLLAAIAAGAFATYRLEGQPRWLMEACSRGGGGLALVYSAGAAVASNDADFDRAQLPVTIALALGGLVALSRKERSTWSFGPMPLLAAAGAWSLAWTFDLPDAGSPTWLTVALAVAATGYIAVRRVLPSEAETWQRLMILCGAVAVISGHAIAADSSREGSALQLPFVYGVLLLGAAWEIRSRRDPLAMFAAPALFIGAGLSASWLRDLDLEYWTWAPLTAAVAILATERWWQTVLPARKYFVPYALAMSLAPLVMGDTFLTAAWPGVVSYAVAAGAWLFVSRRADSYLLGVLDEASGTERGALTFAKPAAAAVGGGLALAALGYTCLGLEVTEADARLVFAIAGIAIWLVAAYVCRLWPDYEAAFLAVGAVALVVQLAVDEPPVDQAGVSIAIASVAAAVATRSQLSAWRWTMFFTGFIAVAAVSTVIVEEQYDDRALMFTALIVAIGFAWDALGNRNFGTLAALPATLVIAATSGLWLRDVEREHFAWPSVVAGAGLAATSLLWTRGRNSRIGGWANALGLSLVPLALMVVFYDDAPWVGAGAFALAAATWALCAIVNRAPAASTRPRFVETVLGLAAMALSLIALAYASKALGLAPREASWLFIGFATVAWLSMAVTGRWANRISIIATPPAVIATLIAALSTSDARQGTILLGIGTAGSAASIYGLRRWWMLLITSGFGTLFLFAFSQAADLDRSTLAVCFAVVAVGSAIGLATWRTWNGSEASIVSTIVPMGWYLVALLTIGAALNSRESELLVNEYLPATREWAAATIIVLLGGVVIALEGIRLKNVGGMVLGALVIGVAIEMGIAITNPITVQAYTTPIGLALVAGGLWMRRSEPMFGPHMSVHEGVMVLGLLVIILPGAADALSRPDIRWSLLLIGEGLLFLAGGFALGQRWLVVGGVLTLVGVAVRFFASGGNQPPYWVTLGLLGTGLLGLGVLLLSARDWWDRRKDQLAAWWLGEGGSGDTGGPASAES